MKRWLVVAALITGCGVSPNAGEEAVLISKPWFFGHGGVHATPIQPGLSWVAPTTDYVIVNIQPQLFKVHFDDFMSLDGVPLDFDAALRLQITDSVRMVEKFGVGLIPLPSDPKTLAPQWYVNNVHKNFETFVRQAVRKHGLNETAISTVAIEQIDAEVQTSLEAYLKSVNLPVKLVDLTVGRANPPDAVKTQRIRTAEEQQRKLTEDQRKIAEDARRAAELSRASADNAYRLALQLEPDQFIRLEAIKMQRDVCHAPNSHCTFILGAEVAPVLNVKK
jgi:regulator of protease activity HflC (stomatin/prohibitin superfamily)